jgi:hypothetical protein
VQFKPGAPEYRFDFTFPALTREPPATRPAAASRTAAPPTAPSPAAGVPATAPEAAPEAAAAVTPLPGTMSEMLDALRARHAEIRDLITRGDFGAVWVPAFQAKDLAIALEPHVSHLDARARGSAEPAIVDVVRTAWLLDSVGDSGNREAVERAFGTFGEAVTRLLGAFSPEPR